MSDDSDHRRVPADDCIICSKWPEKDRWTLREMIHSLQLPEIENGIAEQPTQGSPNKH